MEVTAAATVTATAMAVVTTHITVVMAMVTEVITGITVVITKATVTVTTESMTTIAAVIKAPPPPTLKKPPRPQQPLPPKLLQPILLPQTRLPLASPINLVVQEVAVEASSSGKPLAVKVRVSLLRIIILTPVQQTTMKSLLNLRNHQRTRFCSTAATPAMEAAEVVLLLQAAVVVVDLVEVATPTIGL